MYKKILVPLDGSELGECVLPHAEAIGGGCSVPDIVLARVVESVVVYGAYSSEGSFFTEVMAEETKEKLLAGEKGEAQEYLDGVRGRINLPGARVDTVVLEGKAAEALEEYVNKNGVDLVVISTHGRSGVSRWAMGSVADRLLRSVCVPVMMVRAPGCFPGIK